MVREVVRGRTRVNELFNRKRFVEIGIIYFIFVDISFILNRLFYFFLESIKGFGGVKVFKFRFYLLVFFLNYRRLKKDLYVWICVMYFK